MRFTPRNVSRFAALCLAVVAVSSATSAIVFAADAPAPMQDKPGQKGNIEGTVKDKDGGILADQPIRLQKAGGGGTGGGGGAILKSHLPEEFQKAGMQKTVARTKSDSQGKFSFKDVVPGSYVIVSSKEGVGFGRLEVTVVAGQTNTVELKFQ
jgi:protocatechuate 3,4-dioxygenase beta subunit